MRAIVYALCVMELLLDGAKTQTPIDITVEALKEAAGNSLALYIYFLYCISQ